MITKQGNTAPRGGAPQPEDPSPSGSPRARAVSVGWQKAFLVIALLASIGGALVSTKTLSGIQKKIAEAKELARPARLTLTVIAAPGCPECFRVDDAVALLKKQNVAIQEEKTVPFDAPEAQEFIQRLSLTRLPTYLLTGEITKPNVASFVASNGEVRGDTFVFTKITPVFIDPATGAPKGKVSVTLITDSNCSSCFDPRPTVEAYTRAGIAIVADTQVEWNSEEGKKLIQQYAIAKVPTFLMSADVAAYDNVVRNWSGIGTVESDGTYAARELPPPYRDLGKGRIVGLVDVVYLADASCADCYAPADVHRQVLTQGFGVGIGSERTVDAATPAGRQLMQKYKITQVPTVLLSPEAEAYARLTAVWPQVGTVEADQWRVFRQLDALGGLTYKDVSSGQVVRPAAQPSNP